MKKIIIVEDDADLLDTLALFLEGEGYKVWKFERARPVYEKLLKLAPDVMVIDVRLPDSQGDKLAAYVKQEENLKRTKVILISAGEEIAQLAKESNADAYLKKPFSFESLLSVVSL